MTPVLNKAVFLDRDGVLNQAFVREGKPYPPATPEEFHLLPGVLEATKKLKKLGYKLVVATNQPDVSKGIQTQKIVEQMHHRLLETLPLDCIKVCYHSDEQNCDCRKPKPGMLLEAAKDLHIDLKSSFMIGDRWRDVGAGFNAGCKTIFIDMKYAETGPYQPNWTVGSLLEASELILRRFHAS